MPLLNFCLFVLPQDALEPAFQAAKKARVEAQEAGWVQEMEAMAEQQKMKGGAAHEQSGFSWTHALFPPLLPWMQLPLVT